MRRTIAATNPVAYWPAEDGKSASVAGSALPGHPPLTIIGTAPFDDIETWTDRQFSVVYGTAALVDVSKGAILVASPPGDVTVATAAGWTVMAACDFPDSALLLTDFVLLEIDTPDGTYVRWRLVLIKSTYDVQVVAYDASGAGTVVCTDTSPHTGMFTHNLVVWQNGGNISVGYSWDASAFEASGSVAGTLGGVTAIRVNPTAAAPSVDPLPVGHLVLWAGQALDAVNRDDGPVISALFSHVWTNINNGAAAVTGEPATVRLARLCAEDGVALNMPAVDPADEVMMGVQKPGTPLDLYRQCEDADQGVLYELGFGLGYLPRVGRYNRPTTLTIDFAAGQVAEPPEPVDDDYFFHNRITVSRVDGASATAEDAASIAVNGLYEDAVEVNLVSDADLPNHASWRLHAAEVTQWSPEDLQWLAHHEACHAVAAIALGVPVAWADLDAGPDYGGTLTVAADPYTDAVFLLAGWMGSGGHLWGPLTTHDTQEAIELVGMDAIPAAMRDAAAILADRRDDIATVAEALLQHRRLTGDQIAALVSSEGHASWRVHAAAVAELTPMQRRLLAHHEASHAVVAVHLGAEVAWVAVMMRPGEVAWAGLPDGRQYGGTMVRNVDPHTDAVVALAGWMADSGHIFGPRRTHDTEAAVQLVGAAGIPAAMRDAAAILAARRDDIANVREALIRHGRITGEQLAALVRR